MPIHPTNKNRYPPHWGRLSLAIRRTRARWRCEWCGARNDEPHPITGSKVVLTVAHLDGTPENCHPDNLAALCQRCHLNYDRGRHIANRKYGRHLNQLNLFQREYPHNI